MTTRAAIPFEPTQVDDGPELPSERWFGLTLAAVGLVVGAVGRWRGRPSADIAFAVAGLLAVAAMVAPRVLRPLNAAWARLGAVLNRVVSPVVLAIVFFVVVTPYAAVMRWRGRDALRRRLDPAAPSYWIERTQPGPDASSFRRQF